MSRFDTTSAGRGAAAVGLVGGLPPVEMATVMFLRLWSDGDEGRADAWNAAALTMGAACGRRWLGAFEEMVGLMAGFARRPLVRHSPGCPCLGADESAVATLVAAAAEGAREDALMLAMVLVRADMGPALAGAAETVGLGLRRMNLSTPSAGRAARAPTRH